MRNLFLSLLFIAAAFSVLSCGGGDGGGNFSSPLIGNFRFIYTTDSTQEDRVTIYKKTSSTTYEGEPIYIGYEVNDNRNLVVGYWSPRANSYSFISIEEGSEVSKAFSFNISETGALKGHYYVRGAWTPSYSDLHDTSRRYEPEEWSAFVMDRDE